MNTKEIAKGILEYYGAPVEYSEIKELIEQARLRNGHDENIAWNGEEYRVISDSEIKEIFVDEIQSITEEYFFDAKDIPWWIAIDWEKTAQNCLDSDGYGNHFSSYDGGHVNTDNFHIFRVG